MVSERRVPEASGLRGLFHDQWTHLSGLLSEWNGQRADVRDNDAALAQAIDAVVDGTDPRMRSVGRYQRRLRDSVGSVLTHVNELVDGLPGAISVNQKAFASDPQVNAFFVNKKEMKRIFSCSRALREFFSAYPASGLEEAYALLFLSKKEKTVFGAGMMGDVAIRDIPQTSVSFTDHRILAPRPTEEDARSSLKETLFNSVVEYVMTYMAELRSAPPKRTDPEDPRSRPGNLKNPEIYLEELTRVLSEPTDLLKLERNMLRVSKLGIKITGAATAAANEIDLTEFNVGEHPPRIVSIVKYPRNGMLRADELRRDLGRYFVAAPHRGPGVLS